MPALNDVDRYAGLVAEMAVSWAPRLLMALALLLLGLWVIRQMGRLFVAAMERRQIDVTLTPFLAQLLRWTLRILLSISVASLIGIPATSFLAVLGAAGLAVGLALKDSLSNFAGGVLILLLRPYRVGDLIEVGAFLGRVRAIQIFTTTLISPQNRHIVVPNGLLANGTIKNYTAEPYVRVDTLVGISYGADIDQAKSVLRETLSHIPGVLEDPAPVVAVMALADSSVNLVVRPYCKPEDYWEVHFATVEASKKALDRAGIVIPFPQRDVHLHQENS